MSSPAPQNLKNHARSDYLFQLLFFLVLFPNLIIAIVHLVRHPGYLAAWLLVLSLAIIVLYVKVRSYPLKVQDRLIRLEERLRLQQLAPAEWRANINRLSEDQLIALRFASDDEVVALAQLALSEDLKRKQIKERIKNWRADNWRV